MIAADILWHFHAFVMVPGSIDLLPIKETQQPIVIPFYIRTK
jgi:hypothetical protein